MEKLPPPAACPGCQAAWSPEGRCPRCGLFLSEAVAWLREGCVAYERARRAAEEGRFADAREHLNAVRMSGITILTDDPAVTRLGELCASALGSSEATARVAAQDETAARNAVDRCDFRAAAFYAERAARALPGNLVLRKLRLLTLYGAGRMREAAEAHAELKATAPADPDLLRWRFADLEPPSVKTPRRISARTPGEPAAEAVVLLLAASCVLGGFWFGARNRGK